MSPAAPTAAEPAKVTFRPKPVHDFEEAGLNFAQVEGLILKFLLSIGVASGRKIADELGLPFGPFPEFLRTLKNNQIVGYTNSTAANDYMYSLTDTGRNRAKVYLEECAYVGTAPVPCADYVKAVAAQTITAETAQAATTCAGRSPTC